MNTMSLHSNQETLLSKDCMAQGFDKEECNIGVPESILNSMPVDSVGYVPFLWDTLLQYSTDCIAITNSRNEFIWTNSAVQKFLSQDNRTLIGRSWLDVLPTDLANERIECTDRTITENQDLALIGMIRGVCTCSFFRVCSSVGAREINVIVIISPMQSTGIIEYNPVTKGCKKLYAEHNELGQLSQLTERELEVFVQIGYGYSGQQIADSLKKSTKTIDWHRSRIGEKLGTTNKVEIAKIAMRSGIHHMGVMRPQWLRNLKTNQENNPNLEK